MGEAPGERSECSSWCFWTKNEQGLNPETWMLPWEAGGRPDAESSEAPAGGLGRPQRVDKSYSSSQ